MARPSIRLVVGALGCVLFAGSGCRKSPEPKSGEVETTTLRYLGSPGNVTLPELAEDLGFLAPIQLKYQGGTFSGPQDIQAVVSNDVDFGSAFTGAIIKLVASGADVRMVVASYGIDSVTWTGYYVLDDNPARTAKDVVGSKVAMNTLGAHHEFMVLEWLRRGGLTPDQIRNVQLVPVPPINGEQLLRSRQVEVASLGGLVRDLALEKGGIHPLFRDIDLYGTTTSGGYVFRGDFIAENPRTVARFAHAVGRTLEWTRVQPVDSVVARLRRILQRRDRGESDQIVRFWKSSGISSRGGLLKDADIQTWIDFLVQDGTLEPGALRPSDVYTNAYNPYKDSLK